MKWKSLWPWAKKAVDVEFKLRADVHPALKNAIHHLNKGFIIEAIEDIADFIALEREDEGIRQSDPNVLSLLDTVERDLRQAAQDYEISFK